MALSDEGTWGGTSAGSANAQTIIIPNITSLTNLLGVTISFIAGYSNSGATTLAVTSLAATAIKKPSLGGLIALAGSEIIAGTAVTVVYDGTQFELIQTVVPVPVAYEGVDTGTANAMHVTAVSPTLTSPAAGYTFNVIKEAGANTAAVTLNILGTMAALTWPDGTPLVAGDLPASIQTLIGYNGTAFNLLSAGGPTLWHGLRNIQSFNSSGSYVPTSGATRALMFATGAGGGGSYAIGGGGGGGGTAIHFQIGLSTQAVTIGAGGIAGNSSVPYGGAGGTTSIGSLCIATGANGGQYNGYGYPYGPYANGGQGGVGTAGNIAWMQGGSGGAIIPTQADLTFGGMSFWSGGGDGYNANKGSPNPLPGAQGSGGGGGSYTQSPPVSGAAGGTGFALILEF